MHKGKTSAEYLEATSLVEMNPDDMARLQISDGGLARVGTSEGHVDLRAVAGDLPPGLVFVPMGTVVNALIGCETLGTGMPSFKGLAVTVERSPAQGVAT